METNIDINASSPSLHAFIMDEVKQLKIKCGSVQRYDKEVALYKKEVADLQQKLDNLLKDNLLKDEAEEEWPVKNTRRMIQESEKMIHDTETRLSKAVGELSDFVKLVKDKEGVMDTKEFKMALDKVERLSGTRDNSDSLSCIEGTPESVL